MYKINDSTIRIIHNSLKQPSRPYILILSLLIGLGWLWSGPGGLDGNPQAALAASDPVIAAAGEHDDALKVPARAQRPARHGGQHPRPAQR